VEIIALILANKAPSMVGEGDAIQGLTSPAASPAVFPAAAGAAEANGGLHPTANGGAATANGASGTDGGSCSGGGHKVAHGGTLVICPSTLLQQWRAELGNHAHGSLRVEVYDGLAALRPPPSDRKKPVRPGARPWEGPCSINGA
jgi:hypothetical protein